MFAQSSLKWVINVADLVTGAPTPLRVDARGALCVAPPSAASQWLPPVHGAAAGFTGEGSLVAVHAALATELRGGPVYIQLFDGSQLPAAGTQARTSLILSSRPVFFDTRGSAFPLRQGLVWAVSSHPSLYVPAGGLEGRIPRGGEAVTTVAVSGTFARSF